MNSPLMMISALGIAQIRLDAIVLAQNAALKIIQETPGWDRCAEDPHKVYYHTLVKAIGPYLDTLIAFGKQNGYSEVVEMYLDALITCDEFLLKLADQIAQKSG